MTTCSRSSTAEASLRPRAFWTGWRSSAPRTVCALRFPPPLTRNTPRTVCKNISDTGKGFYIFYFLHFLFYLPFIFRFIAAAAYKRQILESSVKRCAPGISRALFSPLSRLFRGSSECLPRLFVLPLLSIFPGRKAPERWQSGLRRRGPTPSRPADSRRGGQAASPAYTAPRSRRR